MRIISGKYKGKRLLAPKKLPVRPTTDFAKEALFNILNNQLDFSDISLLDLFAGTGNISYEFASRGTAHITSVDGFYGCVKYISKINDELDFSIQVIKSDVYAFLARTHATYDVIFADPPYDFTQEKFEKIVSLVFSRQLLTPNGLLIIEHSKHTNLSETPHFDQSRRYGGSVFSFFGTKA